MPVVALRAPLLRIPKMPGAGPHIRQAMEAAGLDLPELARRTGLTKRRLDQLRGDARYLTIRDAHLLSEALGVSSMSLMFAQQVQSMQRHAVSRISRELNRSFHKKH